MSEQIMSLLTKRGQHLNTWHVHSCSCPSSLDSTSVVPSKPHTRISIFHIYYDVLPCKGNIMWSDRMITDTLINWLFPFEEPFSVITFLKIWCCSFFFIKVACWEWKTVFAVVVGISHQVVSNSSWPHGLQPTRLPCPSLSPRVCPNSCPLNWWCHPTISSSVVPFSYYLQ